MLATMHVQIYVITNYSSGAEALIIRVTVTDHRIQKVISELLASDHKRHGFVDKTMRGCRKTTDTDDRVSEAAGTRRRNGCQKACAGCSLNAPTLTFLKCQPLNFKGTEGVVGLTQWFEKMESVYSISNCTVACQVKFATCTLQGNALTWCNSHVKTTTPWISPRGFEKEDIPKTAFRHEYEGECVRQGSPRVNSVVSRSTIPRTRELSIRALVRIKLLEVTPEGFGYNLDMITLCISSTNQRRTEINALRERTPSKHSRICYGALRNRLGNVLKRGRVVAYKLELPQELSRVHNTFHVSNLKKCYSDDPLVVPLEGLQVDDKLHFVEEPVEIMDREVKQLRRSRVPIVKVRWNSRRGPEFTWEREDQFRKKYPHLFTKTAPSSSAV
ncbi:hypothetical protein Tco_0597108 [Tanacetum coccineum]